MQEIEQYRQFAADCRRIARRMNEKDKEILMRIAEAWDSRIQAAEQRANKSNGQSNYDGYPK